ncbi:heavy metal-binding domain-containing protein [Rufibacter sp. LB8]|uniref:heavy metal-binding domain-containing protein n=1 Tax=Rufibacter sp. LB8 TaxID=2777781 RepID=UPI00351C0E7B
MRVLLGYQTQADETYKEPIHRFTGNALSDGLRQDRRACPRWEDASYTCPMHPQIVEGEPGSCPICGMDLVLVQKQKKEPETASAFTCPMHPQIVEDKAGSCPICGMDLVPVKNKATKARKSVSC